MGICCSTGKGAPPSAKLVAFGDFFDIAMHVVPVGLVQFADFASDVSVVSELFSAGDDTKAFLAIGFMSLSVAIVWLFTFGILVKNIVGDTQDFERRALPLGLRASLLAPLNLHTLYLGAAYATAKARLAVAKAGLGGQRETIK